MVAVVVALAVGLAGPAHAAGPLLSGYGGPGGGEQVLLDDELRGGSPAAGPGGGGDAPGGAPRPLEEAPITVRAVRGTGQGGAVEPPAGEDGGAPRPARGGAGEGDAGGRDAPAAGGGSTDGDARGPGPEPGSRAPAPEGGAPPPTDAPAALSGGDLGLLFLGAFGVGAVGLATRRLARGAGAR